VQLGGGLRLVGRSPSPSPTLANSFVSTCRSPSPSPALANSLVPAPATATDGGAEPRGRSLKLLVGTYSRPGDAPNLQLVDVLSGVVLAATVHGGRDGKSIDVLSSAVSRDGALVAAAGVSADVVAGSVRRSLS
jgi:hypothetical protein